MRIERYPCRRPGDVVAAKAASNTQLGASDVCRIFVDHLMSWNGAAFNVTLQQVVKQMRGRSIVFKTWGLIHYDRSITGDPRGIGMRLPGDEPPPEDLP